MSDDSWRRHANPWSVFTRFAAIPVMILAIWSRIWIGWWALLPVFVVIVWLWINPHAFRPVTAKSSWAAKGIYGERKWLEGQSSGDFRAILRFLMATGIVGFILLAWGLWKLHGWAVLCGTILIIMAQLWRIDRLGILYEQTEHHET